MSFTRGSKAVLQVKPGFIIFVCVPFAEKQTGGLPVNFFFIPIGPFWLGKHRTRMSDSALAGSNMGRVYIKQVQAFLLYFQQLIRTSHALNYLVRKVSRKEKNCSHSTLVKLI